MSALGVLMQVGVDPNDRDLDEPTVALSPDDLARIRARIDQMDEELLSFSLDAPPLVVLDAATAQTEENVGHGWAQGTLVAACVAGSVVLVLSVYAM